jgi:hypothetical protein
MTSHNWHMPLACFALPRSEPDTAHTAFWLARQVTLCSTDSVRLHYRVHHCRPVLNKPYNHLHPSDFPGQIRASKPARCQRLHQAILLVLRNARSSVEKPSPVTVGAREVSGTSVPFTRIIHQVRGRSGHEPADRAL